MEDKVRSPIVAGMFYPADPSALRDTVNLLLESAPPLSSVDAERESLALIVPHAGYIYSGPVAAAGYAYAKSHGTPNRVIILGANHSGFGAPVSLAGDDAWRTPLGDLPLDTGFIRRLADAGFAIDDAAFVNEHSVEVQVPFVQVLWGRTVPLVPICIRPHSLEALVHLGQALAAASSDTSTLIVASSDFTHYEPDDVARARDHGALQFILSLDVTRFHTHCIENRLSICGVGAITATMELACALGLTDTQLLSYATSGDTSGEHSAVVGYAAVAFEGASE